LDSGFAHVQSKVMSRPMGKLVLHHPSLGAAIPATLLGYRAMLAFPLRARAAVPPKGATSWGPSA
jgi:hypothetical protein